MHALLLAALLAAAPPSANPWHAVAPGLDWAEFDPAWKVAAGDGLIHVLRIDPSRWELRLINAADEAEPTPRSARDWCAERNLAAAINAGMYQEDGLTPVSLQRSGDRVYNGRLSRDRSLLVFGAADPALPPARIVDRDCEDWEQAASPYRTVVQSIRMVSCRGENVWSPGRRASSTAAIGIDGEGRILFLHAASPVPTHAFIEAVLALPLGVERCLYAEGGGEAQLFVSVGDFTRDRVGLTAGGLLGGEGHARPVPNVIGIVPRRGAPEDP